VASLFLRVSRRNEIPSGRLTDLLLGNAPNLQSFLETILVLATDVSDMASQKLALIFLFKFVTTFGAIQSNGATTPAKTNGATIPVPGIEQFIYNRILLACFTIPSLPNFDPMDAMAVIVCVTLSVYFVIADFSSGVERGWQPVTRNRQGAWR